MTLFFRRFMGALVLDAAVFEDIEADRHAAMQSVAWSCWPAWRRDRGDGIGRLEPPGFLAGAVIVLGAWLLWVTAVAALGTITFAEPDTGAT